MNEDLKPTLTFENHTLPDIPSNKQATIKPKEANTPKKFAAEYEQRVLETTKQFLPKHDSPTYRFTEEELTKLTEAFIKDHSLKFACLYAGITEQYYKTNISANPTINEYFNSLKEVPQAIAQEGIIEDIKTDKQSRQWYAETRMSHKYSKKQQVEHTVNMSSLLDQMEQTDKPTHLIVDEQ
jgi:hypothetical protein